MASLSAEETVFSLPTSSNLVYEEADRNVTNSSSVIQVSSSSSSSSAPLLPTLYIDEGDERMEKEIFLHSINQVLPFLYQCIIMANDIVKGL